MRAFAVVLLAASLPAASLPAPPAGAVTEQRLFTVAQRYLPNQVEVRQGTRLLLTNLDTLPHNVISSDVRADGQPWFRSTTIVLGGTTEVVGVPTLPRSVFPFLCTLHPEMVGMLTVTS